MIYVLDSIFVLDFTPDQNLGHSGFHFGKRIIVEAVNQLGTGMEPKFTKLKLTFMMVFLPDFILEASAGQVTVEGFVSLDCVLLQHSFRFHFVCPCAGHICTRLIVLVICVQQ